MNSLEKQPMIKKENLNPTYYVSSLLQEAYRLKLMTDAELETLQLQGMQLLAKQIKRYTGGESSSVREETAQSILQSILYTIGVHLKRFSDVDECIVALKQEPLSELYKQGQKLIKEYLSRARVLFRAVQDSKLATDHIAYNDTLRNGIPSFFSHYDVEFAAHETPGLIDYPLSQDKVKLAGIEYISGYLQTLILENQFCHHFSEDDIECLLSGYDAHYEDLLINLFEVVLTNAVGAVLAHKNPFQLSFEPLDLHYLQRKLEGLSNHELMQVLQGAASQLSDMMNITHELTQKHMARVASELSTRVKNALENKQLGSVFICLQHKASLPTFRFEDSEQLDDEMFRGVIDEIRECRYVSDKIAIIKQEIHSFTDLVDMLQGYCLFGDEFTSVFHALGDVELALLFKKLPTHRVDPSIHFTENEKEWHHRLQQFLEEIDGARGARVKELAETINLD